MSLHPQAFDIISPTEAQVETMAKMRYAFAKLAAEVEDTIRPGPDREHVVRMIRDAALWANVAITRDSDGAPR